MNAEEAAQCLEGLKAKHGNQKDALSAEAAAECNKTLSQLKIAIAQFGSCAPVLLPGQALDVREVVTARDILEYAVFLSMRQRDLQAFERHVNQLYPYYQNYQKDIPPSDNELPIVGMQLLHLLAANRIGDFHVALERIPLNVRLASPYLSFVVELETHLMEGNYAKILKSKQSLPNEFYGVFMDQLVNTIRESNAKALELSYEDYNAEDACIRLMLSKVGELENFCSKRNKNRALLEKPEAVVGFGVVGRRAELATLFETTEKNVIWELNGNRLHFRVNDELHRKSLEPFAIMDKLLGYATELERIV